MDDIRNSYDNRGGHEGSLALAGTFAGIALVAIGGGLFNEGDKRDALFALGAVATVLFIWSGLLWIRARDRFVDESGEARTDGRIR